MTASFTSSFDNSRLGKLEERDHQKHRRLSKSGFNATYVVKQGVYIAITLKAHHSDASRSPSKAIVFRQTCEVTPDSDVRNPKYLLRLCLDRITVLKLVYRQFIDIFLARWLSPPLLLFLWLLRLLNQSRLSEICRELEVMLLVHCRRNRSSRRIETSRSFEVAGSDQVDRED